MPTLLPATGKPRLSTTELEALLRPFDLDRGQYPVIVVGIRGYYKNSMGAPEVNDRGIYDDAIFVHSPSVRPPIMGTLTPLGTARGTAQVVTRAWPRSTPARGMCISLTNITGATSRCARD
jgi:hypothetical protein